MDGGWGCGELQSGWVSNPQELNTAKWSHLRPLLVLDITICHKIINLMANLTSQ